MGRGPWTANAIADPKAGHIEMVQYYKQSGGAIQAIKQIESRGYGRVFPICLDRNALFVEVVHTVLCKSLCNAPLSLGFNCDGARSVTLAICSRFIFALSAPS
jgi:hypothetical protein